MTCPSHQAAFHAGEKGRSARPCLKVAACLFFVSLLSAAYMLGDFTSIGYIELIRRTEDIDKTSFFTYINVSEASGKEGYLVWNPSCRIPDINPWHESVKQFMRPATLPGCGRRRSGITRDSAGRHILTVEDQDIDCCYSLITRTDMPYDTQSPTADDVFTIGKCVDFKHNVTFTKEEQFIRINCRKHGLFKSKTSAYTNMHAFVRKTATVQKKIEKYSENKNRTSVLFFGIDSISRLNLFRTMPHTVDYLKHNGWLNLKGYNKIDDNTFPNLMAILMGYSLAQVRATCYGKNLDRCPIIWKDFSKQGYVTVYAEDEPTIGSFNYHKSGFVITPTDYYLRPFMLVAEKLPFIKKKDSLKVCLGPTPAPDHIIEYAIDFVKTFRDNPFFGLFWMNSFSHNNVNTPSAMDNRILKFFTDLEKTGALNNTIVIFLSDHGVRFGKIRETYIGWLEERLPFIYFWFPESFKRANPEKYHSLTLNADRLTSPYDLHATLQELLGFEVNGTKACPKCQTLFQDVPWNRSCADAGVTEHWCTCAEYKMLSTESGPVRNIARFVLDHLNTLLKEGKTHLTNGTKCATLNVHKILSLRSKVFSKRFSSHEEYVILFETLPGEALFEATVAHENTFRIMDTVSRINAYGGQSKCMKDAFLQKYCFCQN